MIEGNRAGANTGEDNWSWPHMSGAAGPHRRIQGWSKETMCDHPAHYCLVIRTHLSSSWAASLPIINIATTQDANNFSCTRVTLRVADQSELIGLLVDLHAHGILVESLEHLEPVD